MDRDAGTYTTLFTTTCTKTPVLTIPDVAIAAGKIRTFVTTEKAGSGAPLETITLAEN